MSGLRSRNKGKAGEREVAALLNAAGIPARRGRQYAGHPDAPDIIAALPGYRIEVKRAERINLYAALQQAADETLPGDVPVVLHRQNGKPWVAILYLGDWIKGVKP